jgi:hypothetical protein
MLGSFLDATLDRTVVGGYTSLGYRLTRPLLRTPAQGADTIVWLGAAPQVAIGTEAFWQDRARRPAYLWPGTRETPADRERLWRECEGLTESSRA